ncbi:hypothetical protein [Rhodococcus sovatensis]|uniref:LGFP repeat-containing protein n=1 Tax=Rhodococcus sovatensis TaxID=1805840 RepID=A0ABZ2PMB8_9NOCA
MREAELQARNATSRAAADCQQYWPSSNWVCGAIRDKYNSLGAQNSFLLWPTSDELVNPDGFGRRNTFVNGPIYWSAATGAHPVVNSFLNRWGIHGYEAGWLHYPTTDEIVLPDGGRRQEFQDGVIYVAFQNAIGSALPNGPIRDKYNALGGLEPAGTLLGYPTQDQAPLPDGQGQMDRFERGVIYWSPSTGAHPVAGGIYPVWSNYGYETGRYGYPTSDEYPLGNGVVRQDFQNGPIDWSPDWSLTVSPSTDPPPASVTDPNARQAIEDDIICSIYADEPYWQPGPGSVSVVLANGAAWCTDAPYIWEQETSLWMRYANSSEWIELNSDLSDNPADVAGTVHRQQVGSAGCEVDAYYHTTIYALGVYGSEDSDYIDTADVQPCPSIPPGGGTS